MGNFVRTQLDGTIYLAYSICMRVGGFCSTLYTFSKTIYKALVTFKVGVSYLEGSNETTGLIEAAADV